MHPLKSAILFVWNYNLDYAQKLIKDLPEKSMASNPEAAPDGVILNHPAWVFSHLCVYHPAAISVLKGEPIKNDPINHPFGMKSKPELNPSLYLPKEKLLQSFIEGHKAFEEALKSAAPEIFEAAPPLERWRSRFKSNAELLNYLACFHESTHLGQVSVWRRISGLPAV